MLVISKEQIRRVPLFAVGTNRAGSQTRDIVLVAALLSREPSSRAKGPDFMTRRKQAMSKLLC